MIADLANLFPPRIAATIRRQSTDWLVSHSAHVLQMAEQTGADVNAVQRVVDAVIEFQNPTPPIDSPIVDVVVPFCQTDSRYLAECLAGLDAQKHVTPIAHVVSDQAEWTDLPAFEKLTVRRYETAEQSGPYRIANALAKFGHLRAEWMAIQDADDISRPDRLWRQIQILRTTGADMISSAAQNFIDPGDDSERIAYVMRVRPVVRPGVVYSSARLGCCVNPTRTMRRRYFEAMNGFVPRPCSGDYCFDGRGRYSGAHIIDDQTILADRRLHDRSLSHGLIPMGSPAREKEMQDMREQQDRLEANPTREYAASLGGLHDSQPLRVLTIPPAYSSDWVASHQADWTKLVGHLKGQPNVNGLEIGVYEGRSSQWWLGNVCTHDSARLTSVDQGSRYRSNEQWFAQTYGERVRFVQSPQIKFVQSLDKSHRFDFAYLDGSKDADDILQTSRELWPHIKPGGVVIWDDYAWSKDTRRPAEGVDAFVAGVRGELRIVHKGWQFAVCKNS